jgi:hypothetical protein
MTTSLPTLDVGRSFIRGVSWITYQAMQQVASWREQMGIAPVDRIAQPAAAAGSVSPDVRMWLPERPESPVSDGATTTSQDDSDGAN